MEFLMWYGFSLSLKMFILNLDNAKSYPFFKLEKARVKFAILFAYAKLIN